MESVPTTEGCFFFFFRISMDPFFSVLSQWRQRSLLQKDDSPLIPFSTSPADGCTSQRSQTKKPKKFGCRQNPAASWSAAGTLSVFVHCNKKNSSSFHLTDCKYVFLHIWLTLQSVSRNIFLRNLILCYKCLGPPSLVATDQVFLSLTGLISQQGHRERDKQTGNREINTFSGELHDWLKGSLIHLHDGAALTETERLQ